MRITHQNVDKWMFDYCEGNLTPANKQQFFSFLEENPEYREDLEAWKESFISESVPVFEGADALLVSETAGAWKNLAAACLLLLLIGAGAFYTFTSNTNSSGLGISRLNGNGGNKISKNEKVISENTIVENTIIETQNTPSNTTPLNDLTKKRDALPSSHSFRNTTGNYSPNLVNKSVRVLSHNPISNASLYSSVSSNTPEGSNFSPNGQRNPVIQSSTLVNNINDNSDELVTISDENSSLSDQMGDLEINPRDKSFIPWQFTRISDLNPDYLDGKPRVYNENEITRQPFNYEQPKGLTVTNTYEHDLLQPSVFAFQRNASFSGGYRQLEGVIGTRARWIGSEHASYEVVAGFQDYKRKWKSAYGFYAQHNSYMNGALNTTSANAFFAPKIKTDRYTWFEPSINLSYSVMNVSPKMFYKSQELEFITGNSFRTKQGALSGSRGYFDVHAGVQIQSKKMYAVLGIGNILRPKMNIFSDEKNNSFRMPMSMDLTIGTDLKSRRAEEFILSPQIGFLAQGIYNRVWAGSKVRYRNVFTSASVSQKGEIFASAGVRTKIGTFAYKFDLTESIVLNKKMASHGISASLYLRSFSNRIRPILDHGIGSK